MFVQSYQWLPIVIYISYLPICSHGCLNGRCWFAPKAQCCMPNECMIEHITFIWKCILFHFSLVFHVLKVWPARVCGSRVTFWLCSKWRTDSSWITSISLRVYHFKMKQFDGVTEIQTYLSFYLLYPIFASFSFHKQGMTFQLDMKRNILTFD